MPEWIKGDVLDVRKLVTNTLAIQESQAPQPRRQGTQRPVQKVR